MFTLRTAVAGLIVLTACGRPAPEDRADATRTPPNREITGALPPPLIDTDSVKPVSVPKPAAPKPAIARSQHRHAAPARTPASRPADSVSVTEQNTPPSTDSGSSAPTSMGTAEAVASDTAVRPPAPEPATAPEPPPAPERVPAPSSGPAHQAARVVAAGTVIHVSLEDSINSRLDTFGKQISGKVMDNVTGPNGEILVRAGTPLNLTVTRLRSGRGSGKGDLEIRPDSITINGHSRSVAGKIGAVPYELKGRGVTGSEAAKVGVGAAGGAVVGGVITGKTKGAVIGGVIGAAGGAAVASQTATKDVVVAARTPVEVVLSAPLVIR